MKILICNDNPNAHYYERMSWAKALKYAGHEVFFWQMQHKSTYDAFDETQPDIAFLQGYNLTDGAIECIKERPDLKLVVRVSDWSDWNDSLDKSKYPVLTAGEQEKKYLEKIRNLGNPLILHTHHHPDWLDQTHGNWIKNGYNLISLMNCADIFTYCNGQYLENIKSDICFIGGYWPYKAVKLDPWILRLCQSDRQYKIKIFGNQNWPTSKYCGFVHEDNTRHVLKSATICPNVSEPHSTDFGYDIISRPFNLLSNKCFCISDRVAGLEKIFPSIIYADNPEDFEEKIQYYLNREDVREISIKYGYEDVMQFHTAFDRMSDVFFNFELDSLSLLDSKKKFIEQLG